MIPQEKIHIEPTTDCNRDCWFCRPAIPTRMYLPEKSHDRLIGQLKDMKWDKTLHYSGMGEPTMHPSFVRFVQDARKALPDAQISLYTNGDFLTVEVLRQLRVLDIIAWDCYEDDDTAKRIGQIVRDSGFPPEHFRVVDQVEHPLQVCSRAGALFKSEDAKKYWGMPCVQPQEQLCMTADGSWGLCCNDVRWRKRWPGHLSPVELNADPDFQATVKAIAERRGNLFVCRECEISAPGNSWEGKGPARFCPTIDHTRFWGGLPKETPPGEFPQLLRRDYKGGPAMETETKGAVTEEEAAFLYGLAVSLRPACIAEVGTGELRSLRAFCKAANYINNTLKARCEVWTCDIRNAALHKVVEYGLKAHCVLGDAKQLASEVKPKLELVFIDGDHKYESVRDDTKALWPVAADGALFVYHDATEPYGVRKFIAEKDAFIIPSPRGLGIIRKGGKEPDGVPHG